MDVSPVDMEAFRNSECVVKPPDLGIRPDTCAKRPARMNATMPAGDDIKLQVVTPNSRMRYLEWRCWPITVIEYVIGSVR